MKSFLSEVVDDLLLQEPDFATTTLIIPGIRPKAFIKKTFIEKEYQGILPKMQTIEELLQEISGLKLVTSVPLLFKAFEAYRKAVPEPKSFEDFLKFAPTLLKDFDDIDAALCDDKALLDNLISEERIKKWGANMDIGLSEVMKNHLGFWTDAKSMYYALRTALLQNQIAYRGLLSRQASEDVKNFAEHSSHFYYFIGFNALTNAEWKVLTQLYQAKKAKAYWDADTYYLLDDKQEAGDFLRQYKSYFSDDFSFVGSHFNLNKNLTIVNVPKQETQAKYVGNFLKELSSEQRDKTAVVLADEQLLPAVLNALPQEVEKLNITMGMPLRMVSIAAFFKEVFALHMNREKFDKSGVYYFQNVLNIVENSNFRNYLLPESTVLKNEISKKNMIFVSQQMIAKLAESNSFFSIFNLAESPAAMLQNIIEWINLVYEKHNLIAIEQEFLFRFKSIFQQLLIQIQAHNFELNFKTVQQLYQQLLGMESVSFVGEPLVGLQLLGMLETRLLDFENIIITGVNEGTLPLGRRDNSFIPFDYRKFYGLNTFLENDAIYAYHFYRLIQRCQSATFLYNSDTEGLNNGEPSRFLLQLRLESPHQLQEIIATPDYNKSPLEAMQITKTPAVIDQINLWKNKISPSSLSNYLLNPIQFYQQQILHLQQEEEIEEIAGDRTIGNIVHGVLQHLYMDYCNEVLNEYHFKKIHAIKNEVFDKVSNDILLHEGEVRGKNVLVLTVAREMIENVLKKDELIAENHDLVIHALEQRFERTYVTPGGEMINFNGIIDRIDVVDGVKRILDYKTGTVKWEDLRIKSDNLEKLTKDYKGSKAIQLAIYAYMLNEENVTSGIYPLRYFSQDIQNLQVDGNEQLTSENLACVMEQIGRLIDEILDSKIPFSEPE